ncbi:MAG: hypothetical protein ABI551_09390 [Polyangiaceae bacterium]
MLVTNCPRCGKPTPARLASPNELRCLACGYDGPPAPSVVPTLQAAREFLFSRNVLDRQLTAARARALAQNAPLRFGLLFALTCVPFTASFLSMVSFSMNACGGIERFGSAAVSSLPLVGLCFYGVRALLRIKRAQDELRAACAALPPERQGEPALCHVCGGPLPAGDAVVRCSFCRADNYTDLAVISQLGGQQALDVTQYELGVARVEAFVKSVTFEEQKRALLRGLAVFFLAGYPAMMISQLMLRVELPTTYSGRYAFVTTPDGDCLARSPTGSNLSTLVGKRVRTRGGEPRASGVVEKVYASFFGCFAVIVDSDGDSDKFDPLTLCDDAVAGPRQQDRAVWQD